MSIIAEKIKESHYLLRNGVYFLAEKADMYQIPGNAEDHTPEGWQLLKNSSNVISCIDWEHGCFVKLYKSGGLFRTLKQMLRPFPRSMHCLAGALHLRSLGIPTPEVWVSSRSYLVTELVPDDVKFLNCHRVDPDELLDLAAALHCGNMIHGDLNYRNIYCLPDGRMGLIDLDGAELYGKCIPQIIREKEIARLLSSAFFYRRKLNFTYKYIVEKTEHFCDCYQKKTSLMCDFKTVLSLQKKYFSHTEEYPKESNVP